MAQESRFQLVDDAGVAHLYLLSHKAGAEPSDLVALQARQARVRVHYADAGTLIARVAHRIDVYAPAKTRA